MRRSIEPYVTDPETGKSVTRKFLIRFLTSAGGPSEGEDGKPLPATLATIYGPTVVNKEPLYVSGPRDPVKRYIGRAAKIASSENHDENVWVMIADISVAAKRLTLEQKSVLTLRYFYDYSDHSIANARNLTLKEVDEIAEAALDKLTSVLDGTDK